MSHESRSPAHASSGASAERGSGRPRAPRPSVPRGCPVAQRSPRERVVAAGPLGDPPDVRHGDAERVRRCRSRRAPCRAAERVGGCSQVLHDVVRGLIGAVIGEQPTATAPGMMSRMRAARPTARGSRARRWPAISSACSPSSVVGLDRHGEDVAARFAALAAIFAAAWLATAWSSAPTGRRRTRGCARRWRSASRSAVAMRATFVQAWTADEILTFAAVAVLSSCAMFVGGRSRRARRGASAGRCARDRHAGAGRRAELLAAGGARRTTRASRPAAGAPPSSADVCIVGGGFAGLWTAVQLTEREPGLRIALIEQDIVGGGASGRNGGFVSSSWYDLDAIVGLFGDDGGAALRAGPGRRRRRGSARSPPRTASTAGSTRTARCGVAGRRMAGELRRRPRRRRAARRRATGSELLDAAQARAMRGLPAVPRRGVLRRQRDLPAGAAGARAPPGAARAGRAHLRTHARCARLERSRPAVVRTEHGAVRGRPGGVDDGRVGGRRGAGFRRSFGVISDYVVATEPIPDRLEEIGWTSHVGIADGRDWLYYLRPTDDGRIVIGGGAGGAVFGGRGERSRRDPRARGIRARRRPAGCCGCSRSSRASGSRTRGAVRSTRRRRSCRSTGRWTGQRPRGARVQRARARRRPTSAGTSSRRRCSGPTTSGPRWRSTGPRSAMAPPEPFRYPVGGARPRGRWGAATRGEEAGRSRGLRSTRLVGGAPIRYRERAGAPRPSAALSSGRRPAGRSAGCRGSPTVDRGRRCPAGADVRRSASRCELSRIARHPSQPAIHDRPAIDAADHAAAPP